MASRKTRRGSASPEPMTSAESGAHHLYDVDPRDVSLYDIVLQIRPMTIDDAVGTIKLAAQLPAFQTTPEVKKTLEELAARAAADAKA